MKKHRDESGLGAIFCLLEKILKLVKLSLGRKHVTQLCQLGEIGHEGEEGV